ncbi:acyltransferase domain-containing protein [Plectonema radiosum NIES-515]|uniref:Acyltransferase domain-containing protein n=1 Tax=Plectonema radiosum NIES-515 TaxID=2986073 RepID=A0ABT3AXS9_9CYAN|nr:beta-ketoacyl synthase N-terminal-like domain-containing protein [Plectonema radiosum]MCV3213932.1 acyltransferase domain-containing protein [Plectonema radiosum NIES-515]
MDKLGDFVAVIGISCRFPGARSYHQFWENLKRGVNSITEIPSNRWNSESFYSPNPESPNKTISKWGGFIADADKFDATFFGISPREATLLDPQQRLMLELAWTCLEDSGYAPSELSGANVGVFIGVCNSDYKELLEKNLDNIEGHISTGTYTSIIPNRLSYFFNFRGPSVAVDTACSSSLVAIHNAIYSLKEDECEMALVGSVNILCTPTYYISFSKLGMLSPQGQCKTFDAEADGYVRGEGAGVILLKPLSRAIEDRDHIYGVIRGSAINHGGRARTLTSPNAYAQSQVIRSAYKKANISPDTISYIETHGTGTPLGDPIEVNGLKRAFTQLYQQYEMEPNNEPYCGLGSVKTNIGHLESASGVAGVIKVLLAMKHQELPKTINYQHLNPRIKLDDSPFYIVEDTKYWEQLRTKQGDIIPRRAGVSSFGFGGVNAHIVLEEAPAKEVKSPLFERSYQLLTLSTKTKAALAELAQSYANFLATNADLELADICFTANLGRSHFKHRLALVAESIPQLSKSLSSFSLGEEAIGVESRISSQQPKIAFLFTGQGSQYVGMGRLLYETQPTFRDVLIRCEQILQPYMEIPLLSLLYPQTEETSPINETVYTQTALFALEYALYQLWISWGIKPDVVMGHSVGEYVAACVAGIFSLEDGLKLIAQRGRLMQSLPSGGAMAAIMDDEAEVRLVIAPHAQQVEIAAINGSQNTVISGDANLLQTICQTFADRGVKATPLQVSHAFHSSLMEPMLKEFAEVANQITYNQPQIPLISNLTGNRADERISTADYWVSHVCQPVKFAKSMETLHQEGYEIFLEVGPKPILLGMGRQCLPEGIGTWLPSLRESQADWQQMLQSLAELYVRGVKVDWLGFDRDYARKKVVLPTYPFQRQRYWIETNHNSQKKQYLPKGKNIHPLLGQKLNCAGEQEIFASFIGEDTPAYLGLAGMSEILSEQAVIVAQSSPADEVSGSEFLLKLESATFGERRSLLIAHVRHQLSIVLGINQPESISLETGFFDLGIDSLIAVELRNKLRSATGVELPVGVLFDHPTINQLASFLLDRIAPQSNQQNVPIESSVTSKQDALVEVQSFALTKLGLSPASHPLHLPPWTVRPAVMTDVAKLSQLEREAYGWIGEEAIAPPFLIADRIDLLNSGDMPWFWVMERNGELGAWQVLQPTSVDPYTYGSWSEVTDHGRLQVTFDPTGRNVYIVASGFSKRFPTVASYLMKLQTLLMLQENGRDTIFTCLAMPGYAKYHSQTRKSPEEYIAMTDKDGIPIDEFIALFVYDWPVIPSFRVLRDGYPPDRDSGGHGVSTVFKLNGFDACIEETCRRIIHHAHALGLEKE